MLENIDVLNANNNNTTTKSIEVDLVSLLLKLNTLAEQSATSLAFLFLFGTSI